MNGERCVCVSWCVSGGSGFAHHGGGIFDGGTHTDVSATAAQIGAHGLVNFGVAWVLVFGEQAAALINWPDWQ
jgi:hypothetical protein